MHIEEIYKEHSKLVYKYLLCLSHNENISEELTQETFCVAIKKLTLFKENAKFLYGYAK